MEDYDATGEHHLDQKKQHQIFKQRIFKEYQEKNKQHHENNKEKIREKKKRCKNKDTCYDKS